MRRLGWALLAVILTLVGLMWLGPEFLSRAEDPVFVAAKRVPPDLVTSAGPQLKYASFNWQLLTAADLATLDTTSSSDSFVANSYLLTLGGRTFDPLLDEPVFPTGWGQDALAARTAETENGLHLVQFIGPIRSEWLTQLEAAGLDVLQYIHPFTYVVWGNPNALAQAAQLRSASLKVVRWTGPFLPAYRVLPQWRTLSSEAQAVRLMIYRPLADETLAALAALGASQIKRQRHLQDPVFDYVTMTLPADRFQAAAILPGVYSLKPIPQDGGLRGEISNQVVAGNIDADNLAQPGYQAWLDEIGLDGSGVILANVDSGVRNDHPDLVNRLRGCQGQTCGGSTSSNHGTHTAGIMVADASSGEVDENGFLRGLGIAPGSTLVEQLYSPFFLDTGGMLLLMSESYTNGAVLSSNSWGPSGSPLGYDDDTRQVDLGVRDAVGAWSGNQSLHYVLAINNGGGGTSSQGTPDEAKNTFTIGSTELQDSSGIQLTTINDISANSAHGPALDGRTIPHLVAPGCYVDSTGNSSNHYLECGTSMAAPHVSGAAALFIQDYRQQFGLEPSPALLKAAFLPVAYDLAGNRDADNGTLGHPFDNKQGWGRLNLSAVVSPTASVLYFDGPELLNETGQAWQSRLRAADPAQPVRLMLVWTDAAGHGLGGSTPAWNNDLDLVVDVGEQRYYGNNFDAASGWSMPGGSPDGRNNTEGIFLPAPQNEALVVRVVAANITSDGVPNLGDGTDQDFALVCYNCVPQPGFNLTVLPSNLAVCAADEATYTLSVEGIAGFKQAVSLSLATIPAEVEAVFTPPSLIPASPPATSTLRLSNLTVLTQSDLVIPIVAQALTLTERITPTLQRFSDAPAAPVLLSPTHDADQVDLQPTLVWSASDAALSYGLEVATDALFTDVVYRVTGLQTLSHTLTTTLSSNQYYYWRVQAENPCGTSSFGSARLFITVPPVGQCSLISRRETLFRTDFETTLGHWQLDGTTNNTWARTDFRSYEGDHAYYALNLSEVSDQRLVSPPIALPNQDQPTYLSFWQYQYLESQSGGGCYDGALLEISTDAGQSWTQLESELLSDPYDGEIFTISTPSLRNPLSGQPAWCGDPADWTEAIVDLQAYHGQTVQFRFRLGTDFSLGRPEGWYIDDLTVATCYRDEPGLTLSKTVAPSTSVCPGQSVLNRRPGEAATYCYTIANTGNVTLTISALQDDGLGFLPLDVNGTVFLDYPLPPTSSLNLQATASFTRSGSIVHQAVVTATSLERGVLTATAQTRVDVAAPQVMLTHTLGLDADVCAATTNLTAVISDTLHDCYTIANTGSLTLTRLTLRESTGRLVFDDASLNLAPGGQLVRRVARTLTQTGRVQQITHLTAADAFDNQATALATTTLTLVALPAVSFTRTLAPADATCPGQESLSLVEGSQIKACYALQNTGGLTLTRHYLLEPLYSPVAITLSYLLPPGQVLTYTLPVTPLGTLQSTASLTSANAPYQVTAQATATTTVLYYGVSMSSGRSGLTQTGISGRILTHTVLIANSGDLTDSLVLTMSPTRWSTVFTTGGRSLTRANVSPFTVYEVPFLVTIPFTATEGMTETVTLTLTSAAQPTRHAKLTFLSTATRQLPPNTPAIDLSLTVVQAPERCNWQNGTNNLPLYGSSLPPDIAVTFCYQIENTGNITFTHHRLNVNGRPYWPPAGSADLSWPVALPPWQTLYFSRTQLLTTSQIWHADWTATDMTTGLTATSSALARIDINREPRMLYLPLVQR